ncbi:MAG TPA: hypothetical protein VKM54_11180 [Myxococcota bacterium]|nr:hypothetical protein [Myxococcota bacterium]
MANLDAELDRLLGRPRAERVRWLLLLLAGGAAEARPDETARLLGPYYPGPEGFLRSVRFRSRRMGAFEVSEARCDAEEVLEVDLRDEKGRPWMLRCRIGNTPPYLLDFYSLAKSLPPGLRIRLATEADAPALAALERACPIELDDGSRVTMIRGRSVLDQVRMAAGWARLWLVEDGETLVACDALAVHPARVGGRPFELVYRFHTRVAPSHRRLGLNERMVAWTGEERFRAGIKADAFYVYIDPRNQVIREWSPNVPWRVRPFRALLRCEAIAGPQTGRPATPADAPRIAALLNAGHGREELFLPRDAEEVAARLARVPESYGFPRLWLTEDAVFGVWEDGEERILERAGSREESRRATVLDWGFVPGDGVDSLEALVRAWCARLATRGVTHLSLFASDASPAAPLLRSLAESIVEIEFQCLLPEPSDSAERGFFVDPVYY